jgi:hypothetical protein
MSGISICRARHPIPFMTFEGNEAVIEFCKEGNCPGILVDGEAGVSVRMTAALYLFLLLWHNKIRIFRRL